MTRTRSKAAGRPNHLPSSNGAPSLAELRRRAIHRLRNLSAALEQLQRQRREAAAECARLRAAPSPPALGDRSAASLDPAPAGEAGPAEAPDGVGEELRAERARCRELERARRDLEQKIEELRANADEASAALAAERTRAQELAEANDSLSARVDAADDIIQRREQRIQALEGELRAARETCERLERSASQRTEAASEQSGAQLAALRRELERARADNERIRRNLADLLRFLDQVSRVLAGADPSAARG
jgi:chromosome segregation ATPase